MERHFEKEIGDLRSRVLEMGGAVEQVAADAARALRERDVELAKAIISGDDRIDRMELSVDEAVLEILSREAPVARDLRMVLAASRIAPELERIADLCLDVAERTLELVREPPMSAALELEQMATLAGQMVKDALDAFADGDSALAQSTIRRDDEVDELMEQVFRKLLDDMIENPKENARAVRLMFCAKYWERVADSATNVCEQVVFEIEGRVIKHGGVSDSR